MYQRTEILGYVGKDPEVRYLPDGKAVANFSIATTEKWKDKNTGERQEQTEWHRCTAFERLAELVSEYVTKGSRILVAGKLKTRKYTDQAGVERYSTEITISELKLLPDGRNQQGQQDGQQERTQQQRPAPRPAAAAPGRPAPAARTAPAPAADGFSDMDDDIPF